MAIQRIYGFAAAAEVLGYVKRVAYDSNSRVLQIEAVSVEECISILRMLSIGSVQGIEVGGVGTAGRMPEEEREVVRAFVAEQPEQPLEATTDARKRAAARAAELNKVREIDESARAVEPQEPPAETAANPPATSSAEEVAEESPIPDAHTYAAAAAAEEPVEAKPVQRRRGRPPKVRDVVAQPAETVVAAAEEPAVDLSSAEESASAVEPAVEPAPAAVQSKGNGAAAAVDVPAEVKNAVKLRDIVGYLFDHGHTTAASLHKECERLQPHVAFLRRIPDLRDRIYRGCVSMGIPTE